MLQLILFSPDSIVPSGAKLLSSISILPVFYVYSTPSETQPHTCCLAPCSVEFSVPLGEMAQALAQGSNELLCR